MAATPGPKGVRRRARGALVLGAVLLAVPLVGAVAQEPPDSNLDGTLPHARPQGSLRAKVPQSVGVFAS